jgi:hypothetical protein
MSNTIPTRKHYSLLTQGFKWNVWVRRHIPVDNGLDETWNKVATYIIFCIFIDTKKSDQFDIFGLLFLVYEKLFLEIIIFCLWFTPLYTHYAMEPFCFHFSHWNDRQAYAL